MVGSIPDRSSARSGSDPARAEPARLSGVASRRSARATVTVAVTAGP